MSSPTTPWPDQKRHTKKIEELRQRRDLLQSKIKDLQEELADVEEQLKIRAELSQLSE
jgi:TolA-binding protein